MTEVGFNDIASATGMLTPLLIGVVGYFTKKKIEDTEKEIKEFRSKQQEVMDLLRDHEQDVNLLRKDFSHNEMFMKNFAKMYEEWGSLKREIEAMGTDLKLVKGSIEDVAILKRDQKALWTRIDEIKSVLSEHQAEVKINRDRYHEVNNKLQKIYLKIKLKPSDPHV